MPPNSSELVNECLVALHSAKGITLHRLYSYITETHNMVVTTQRKLLLKKHIISLREDGDIVNVTGRGFVGHFKLVDKGKFIRKLNATRKRNGLPNVSHPTVEDDVPDEPSDGGTHDVHNNNINIQSQKPSTSGVKKRKRREDETEEPTTSTHVKGRRVARKSSKQCNTDEPKILVGSQSSRQRRVLLHNKNTKILTHKQSGPVTSIQISEKPHILNVELLTVPVSQEYPFNSQEEIETNTFRHAGNEEMICSPQSDTSTTSTSVHVATPNAVNASILRAPRRNRSSNPSSFNFTLESIVERTPRTSLPKKRRRFN